MNENFNINAIVNLNKPVLCLDTCSFLDVVRDITRETVTESNVNAGLLLLTKAEGKNDFFVLIAQQVVNELSDNEQSVLSESQKSLEKFKSQTLRINAVATIFGSTGKVDVSHLDDHIIRAQSILSRWKNVAHLVLSSQDITAKAFSRVMQPRTPSRKGKESMKDCVVIETYLNIAEKLRALGMTSPIVFASSNTNDYYASNTGALASDISADFKEYDIEYAPNFGAAKHLLGL